MDYGHTLGFAGDKLVKYADFTSGGEFITMMVGISGGEISLLDPPLFILKNKKSSYHIRGVAVDVAVVSYLAGPRSWVYRLVIL